MGYAILRPNMYMHNVSVVWPASIEPDGNYYAPAGEARISMIDARDVAAVAARVLLDDGHAGRAYDLTGPQALSHAEACGELGAALGQPDLRAGRRGHGLLRDPRRGGEPLDG